MSVTRRLASGAALAMLLALAVQPDPATAQASASPFTTGFRYDVAGRQVGVIRPDPDGDSTGYLAERTTYGAKGLVSRIEHGSLAAWQGDAIAPAAWTGFQLFYSVEFSYDSRGRKVQQRTIANGTIKILTEYAYDAFDRPTCTAVRMNESGFAPAPVDGCTHRPAGAAGPDRITRSSYDNRDRVIQIEKAVGTSLAQVYAAYTYNAGDRPLSVVDANGNRAELTYDGFERQKRWIFPSKASLPPAPVNPGDYEEYDYDSNGNRISLRKRDGVTLGFQYDALNRLILKSVPASVTGAAGYSVVYGYDLRGLQTHARFGSVSGRGIANGYDGFGRLVSSTTDMDGVSRTFNSQYDANGNRTVLSSPSDYHAAFTYDGLDRMSAYREGATTVVGFDYDSAGRRSVLRFGAGATSSAGYVYDGVGRLKSVDRALAGTAADQILGFTHNPASQIVARSSTNDAYASNAAGNVSRAYAVNGLNQYTGAGGATFDYDSNGNLKSVGNVPEGPTSYVYDSENRLVSATGGWNANLAYDPLGRLWQTSGGTAGITRFVYDGDRLVEEYDGNGYRPRVYVHGPGVDEPLVWYEWNSAAVHRFYHADHQGSIVALADDHGNALGINGYDPWGIPNVGNKGRFGYTGQAWLAELGMYYYKARIYSPTLGRFMQTDPIGYDDQINLYAYVGNDPVNKADPLGLRSENPNDDLHYDKKLKERAAKTARVSHKESRGTTIARTIVRGAAALGVALAINEEGEKHDKLKVYRVFGGKAGLRGVADATKGTYWTTEDPRRYDSRSAIRDRYALTPGWGNEITKVAYGYIEAGNPNITTWGTASPAREGRCCVQRWRSRNDYSELATECFWNKSGAVKCPRGVISALGYDFLIWKAMCQVWHFHLKSKERRIELRYPNRYYLRKWIYFYLYRIKKTVSWTYFRFLCSELRRIHPLRSVT